MENRPAAYLLGGGVTPQVLVSILLKLRRKRCKRQSLTPPPTRHSGGRRRTLISPVKVLRPVPTMQAAGDIEGACNVRFHAFQHLAELIPEDEEMILEWEHPQYAARRSN